MKKLDSWEIEKLDDLIRKGQSSAARTELTKLRPSQIPRRLYAHTANLSIRLGAPAFGFKLLQSVIHPRNGKVSDANPRELLEYGGLLQQLGAYDEAMQVLIKIDPKQTPRTLLYQSFVHFAQWEYEESIPLLKRFLDLVEPTHYDALVGQVNYVSALSAEFHDEKIADEFDKLLKHPLASKENLIIGNLHGVIGGYYALTKQNSKARDFLETAESMLVKSHLTYKLYLERWSGYLKFLEGEKAVGLRELFRTQDKALELSRWETYRDNELLLYLASNDQSYLSKVYFGTPLKGYRRRIERVTQNRLIHEAYCDFGNSSDPLIDLEKFEFNGATINSTKLESLIWELTRDLFRPKTIITIFDKVFPNQNFDIQSSENSVYNLISKARKWLVDQNLPLKIEKAGNYYSMGGLDKVLLRLPKDLNHIQTRDLNVGLELFFGQQPFSTIEAAEYLNVDRRNALRRLKELESEGRLEASGPKNNRKYTFISTQVKNSA